MSVESTWVSASARMLRGAKFETTAAVAAIILIGIDIRLPFNAPTSVVIGTVLFPVVFPAAYRYTWFLGFAALVLATVGWGLFMSAQSSEPSSTSLAVAQCLRVLNLVFALAVLLWARGRVGIAHTVLAFAGGMLLGVPLSGIHALNPWKFDLGLPFTLIALSLPFVYRKRVPQIVTGCVLIAINVLFSSRSAAGFVLIAVALGLTGGSAAAVAGARRSKKWLALRYAQVVAAAAGAYFLLQGAILEGMLGEGIQERTQAQISAGGSALVGGRPEMGASIALIAANPWGYGAGALPTPSQILIAKGGMARLGYDPNNGYVEQYMFGTSFEVHSTIGDLWVTFGIPGAILAIVCLILLLGGTGGAMANGTMSTVLVYLVIRSVWDLGFSPIYTSVLLLPLALAVIAAPRRDPVEPPGSFAGGAAGFGPRTFA